MFPIFDMSFPVLAFSNNEVPLSAASRCPFLPEWFFGHQVLFVIFFPLPPPSGHPLTMAKYHFRWHSTSCRWQVSHRLRKCQVLTRELRTTHLPNEPPHLPSEPPHLPSEPANLPSEPPHLPNEPPHLPNEPPHLRNELPHLRNEPPHLPNEPPHLPEC